MASRRATKGALTTMSKTEESVPNVTKGASKTGTGVKKLSQKATTTPSVPGTPPETMEKARPSQQTKKERTVPSDESVPPAPHKLVVEAGSADAAVAAARESEIGVFTALEAVGGFARRASLKDEIGRPSLAASGKQTQEDLSGDTPRLVRPCLPGRAPSLLGESVIGKLAAISELALRLKESRSNYVAELEREKARRAREVEAAEKRIAKIAAENLDRILNVEEKIDKMMVEVTSTRKILGHFDVPEKLEAIRKAVEAGSAPRTQNYAEAAARPKPSAAAAPKIPGPEVRSGAGHTLIISSKCENHTAEQVVVRLRGVVDAREMGVAVDRLRKAGNQKVVMSRSSAEDALKIEERLKIRGADIKVTKGEKKLPTVVIRDVPKVNTDEDIVRSLRTQNKHIADGLDWSRERAKVCYRRRARNDLECHPVLEVTTELYKRLIKAAYVYVGLQRRPVWDQSPLAQCSNCLGYGHSRRFCKEASEK
ncbi:hypothetical protein EVAR_39397_1 [Eumeta japonica]|uniref:Uncharacterized protein n=1 Tax=Eumeta variegata TaxID=151549 RepID=A0A4C1T3D5_EUMVA|nr:hypothetical protein EVAR_39397_1 [Eumeta japonica]